MISCPKLSKISQTTKKNHNLLQKSNRALRLPRPLDSAGWRFVAVVGYLMLIFSCIPTFWQTKISICRSAHSLFVSLRCIHCALLCKSYVCWHSCRCFKTPMSQSGRALVSSDSQSSPTSHTSVSHTIAVKLLPQRVAGHHRSYSSPTEPDR